MEKIEILIATENKNKAREIADIMPRQIAGRPVKYLSLSDLDSPFTLPEETGSTLLENALIKARAAAKESGLPVLADDSGLEVDFLRGRPGVHSARYAGQEKNPALNNKKLLSELDGVFPGERHARFKTVAAFVSKTKEFTAEGVMEGFIASAPRGINGFGYDPVFIMKGTAITLAEMSAEEKNAVSHRKKAFEKIAKYLEEIK